jgi:DNA (cytosine-5)-methyltransferase 1
MIEHSPHPANALRFVANVLTTRPGAPWVLDLFCGAGGMAKGYHDAGWNVVGVDIVYQPRYPYWLIVGDALEVAAEIGRWFDLLHASPPCQFGSTITPDKSKHHNWIPETRAVLQTLNKPYVIENVGGAARHLRHPVMLCGTQFGLKVYRHRFFECNPFILVPGHVPHRDQTPSAGRGISPKGFICVTGKQGHALKSPGVTYHEYTSLAMDIGWMTVAEKSQAIPPAYGRYIGEQMMRVLANQRAIAAEVEAAR